MSDASFEALLRLCDIEPSYHDIWGNEHRVSRDTAEALARAMGVDLSNGVDAAVAALDRARWTRRLDAAYVVAECDGPPTITLRLPVDTSTRPLHWRVTQENGATRAGQVNPATLPRTGSAHIDGREYAAFRYTLPEPLPLGYHTFELVDGGAPTRATLIVTPAACYLPEAVQGDKRVWGIALQLYTVRSERNWGIGDFTDLRSAIERFGERGAAVVGLNPLHALYPHNPEHISPYSPSSRLFVNVLYIDVEGVPEFAQCEAAQQQVYAREFQQRLEALRTAEYVDYAGVAAVKLPVLETLYQYFRAYHLARDSHRARAFRTFQERGGELLYRHALYEALQEHFHRADASVWGWPVWPEAYRDPAAPAVAEFAAREAARVEFYQYLQWQADLQLGAAGRRSAEIGLGVGVYQDLAVSVDRGGAETWALQALYATGASIGAPPDELALQGQDWGLPPLVPNRLRDVRYAPFIATLRANMRHAGALRIDHVMGLMRLFWVPAGKTAQDGAYVHYPFAELLGILALESHRNQCLVIGEDLGTVPNEVRRRLGPMNILSYRLFYFERTDSGEYKPPAEYPPLALAAISTHDLPTLAGYWKGEDLRARDALQLFPSDEMRHRQILARTQDRVRLLAALAREQLLPEGVSPDPAFTPDLTPALARAVHCYLARTPSKLMMVQVEDLIGEVRQVNLPGTTEAYPNWRRKLTIDLDALLGDAAVQALFDGLRHSRGPGLVGGRAPPARRRGVIPDATYRLQFHKDFTFRDAERLVPYLARLGISHCYASPYLKARPGSRHGYDIVDHNALNPEIGALDDYEQFVDALRRHNMGQVLDIVPNHMGIGSDNAWWLDVLENGAASIYADFFDIDWRPLKSELRGKVLLPVLGAPYGAALEAGELTLDFDAARGAFLVRYYDHTFPVDPGTFPDILEPELARLASALGPQHPRLLDLQSLLAAFRHLPARSERTHAKQAERHRDKEMHKRRLAELAADNAIGEYIDAQLALHRASTRPQTERLHRLLEAQAYRLAYWRVAADEINYRRFFDINDLAALRQENPQAFFATHRLIAKLVAAGHVNGLRIDHPDGLYEPVEYYRRLQNFITSVVTGDPVSVRLGTAPAEALYVVTEKILAAYERLPEDWPVHGTTGYDVGALLNEFFVYPGGERELDRLYTRFIGRETDFQELLSDRKRLIMRVALSSELNVLANYLNRISESDWHARDFTLTALREALREVVARFPVYRTYVRSEAVSDEDRRYVEWAVAQARNHHAAADVSVFDFVRAVLLLENLAGRDEAYRRAALDFVMRFQQFTAPVMAKAFEDTTFYIYNRLVSLNEVGGDPRRFGLSAAALHGANQDRARRWPHTLVLTSSHDSKRSEDVRTRISVLSEIAGEWREHVTRWARINRGRKRKINDIPAPARNDEYLLYQTLLGAWPLEAPADDDARAAFCERIESYLMKAVREAKMHTSWINPNDDYEAAIREFVRSVLQPSRNLFLEDFLPFQARVARYGLYASLSQVLLKFTIPGVPDIYQGNELWDFSLVDPDNRRPVDYARRDRLLAEIERIGDADRARFARSLLDTLEDGRAKLYVTWRALTLRRAKSSVFRDSDYVPLKADGPLAEHVFAFARRAGDWAAIVVAPRWFARLGAREPIGPVWAGNVIEAPLAAGQAYRNMLTGETLSPTSRDGGQGLRLDQVLGRFPVALLVPVEN
ncbi:MAG: malto-oligosyltrehalose synthase [Gammaproteobacteria bacterium]